MAYFSILLYHYKSKASHFSSRELCSNVTLQSVLKICRSCEVASFRYALEQNDYRIVNESHIILLSKIKTSKCSHRNCKTILQTLYMT